MTKLSWFQLMWKNFYIQLFVIAVAMFIYLVFFAEDFVSPLAKIMAISVPVAMIFTIGYKGFYQFWKDYKEGKSR